MKILEKLRDINNWNEKDAYIGVFDILGFKEKIKHGERLSGTILFINRTPATGGKAELSDYYRGEGEGNT